MGNTVHGIFSLSCLKYSWNEDVVKSNATRISRNNDEAKIFSRRHRAGNSRRYAVDESNFMLHGKIRIVIHWSAGINLFEQKKNRLAIVFSFQVVVVKNNDNCDRRMRNAVKWKMLSKFKRSDFSFSKMEKFSVSSYQLSGSLQILVFQSGEEVKLKKVLSLFSSVKGLKRGTRIDTRFLFSLMFSSRFRLEIVNY